MSLSNYYFIASVVLALVLQISCGVAESVPLNPFTY